ncbi:MAG: hypothetical protein C4B58_00650 [Deltaproteobacteria bacterium]|nr:MAG: hypothetical protein C4B58_00650 [Deltaproteobacteria bacterium]
MFDQLIAVGRLLVSGLSSLPLQPNKKSAVGKKLSTLHHDLTLLCGNGNTILDLFTEYNNGKDVNIDEIKSLLLEQHVLIPCLLQFFENKDIQTVLTIKTSEIKPLQFLLFAKGSRVKFYLDEIDEKEKRRSEGDRIEWLRPKARVDLPEQNSINRSREQLDKIGAITEELRQFIIEQFEINEII